MEVRDTVLAILAEQALLEPSDLSPEQTPAELGLDSMGMVETVFAIEEAFDIQIPFNANAPADSGFDSSTVGSILTAVERLVAEQKAAS